MIRFFNGRTLTMTDGVSVTTDEVWTCLLYTSDAADE